MNTKHLLSFVLAFVLLFTVLTSAFSDSLARALDLSGILVYLPLIQNGSGVATGPPPPTQIASATATQSPSSTATATSTPTATASATPTGTASATATSTPTPEPGPITRVSVRNDGGQANGGSFRPSMSADGRYIAFDSLATNLVTGGTNGMRHIFVHDRQTRETTLVSVSSNGVQGNAYSYNPSISADGRFVAFRSDASNLVDNDTNNAADIFVHDTFSGETTRVSVDSDGAQGDGASLWPSISSDGQFVAFYSLASNLVDEDTNGVEDVFAHDRATGVTSRVSVGSGNNQGNGGSHRPSISANGRYVAFRSKASNLVDDDTNAVVDIFVFDRHTGAITRVSIASGGSESNSDSDFPVLSADGRFIAFSSEGSNLVDDDTNGMVDVFVHDMLMGTTTRVSVAGDDTEGNGSSDDPAISADGNTVTFDSLADNLVGNDTNGVRDIFVHNLSSAQTVQISISASDVQSNGSSEEPAVSGDGRFVAFHSAASNLVSIDTNGAYDVFVYDPE